MWSNMKKSLWTHRREPERIEEKLEDSGRIWDLESIWWNIKESEGISENLKQSWRIYKNLKESGTIQKHLKESAGTWKNLKRSEHNWKNWKNLEDFWQCIWKNLKTISRISTNRKHPEASGIIRKKPKNFERIRKNSQGESWRKWKGLNLREPERI